MRYLVAFMVTALALEAWGQVESNPYVQLIPELKTMAAPAWVKEGVRLEYYTAAATVGGDVEDTNPAGDGYTQVDIVALDDTHAILNVRSLGMVNPGYQPGKVALPIGSEPGIGIPAAGGDWWLNPKALEIALARGGDDHTTITKMPYTVQRKTYQTVRFQYNGDNDSSELASVYDLDTGVLIASDNRVGPAEGKRTLSQSTFLGFHTIAYPWLDAAVPDWVATATTIKGEFAERASVPSTLPLTLGPVPITGNITDHGPHWMSYNLDTTQPSLPGMPTTPIHLSQVGGIAQIGGLFLPPAGLKALQEDQVIDKDDIIGSETTVTGVKDTGNGTVVTFTETAPGFTTITQYDAGTGKLLLSRTVKSSEYITEQAVITAIE